MKASEILNTDAGKALVTAQIACQRAVEEGTADAVTLQRLHRERQAAQDKVDALLEEEQKADMGRDGDAIRGEIRDAQRFDEKGGRFNRIGAAPQFTIDKRGRAFYPTVALMGDRFELFHPVPEEVKGDPFSYNIHVPVHEKSPDYETISGLQYLNDCIHLSAGWLGISPQRVMERHFSQHWDYAIQRGDIMSPGETGVGSEWVPIYFSASLVVDIYAQATLLGLFQRFAMSGPVQRVPTLGGRPRSSRYAAATGSEDWEVPAVPPQTVATGYKTFNADGVKIIIGRADEFDEDSIVQVAPLLRTEVVKAIAYDIEDAMVNGSTLLTDLDNDEADAANQLWASSVGQTDPRASWDGLRKLAISANSTYDCGGLATGVTKFSTTKLLDMKNGLGKYGTGAERGDCVWIVGSDAENMILGLEQVQTLDKYGSNATVLTGEIGRIFGIPILVAGTVYGPGQGVGLNASGVWDNITKTATIAMLVYRGSCWLGDRRAIKVEEDRSVIAGMKYIVCSWRGDFQKILPATSKSIGVLYNIIRSTA